MATIEYHQQAVDLFSPFNHEWCTYYLNSGEDKFKKLFYSRSAPFLFKNLDFSPSLSLQTVFTEDNVSNSLKVQYSGSNWLFVDRYEILADGEVYKSGEIDFSRDNSSRKVWEWHTVEVDSKLESLLNSIVSDPDATIRFYGKDYYKDVKITNTERNEIQEMLSLSKLLYNKN